MRPTCYSAVSTRILTAQWCVAEGLTFNGRVENLADKRYETAGGYGALGRTVYLGLRSRF